MDDEASLSAGKATTAPTVASTRGSCVCAEGGWMSSGSPGMTGAPVMSSRAAARSGAGMVVCALPGREAAARASADEIVTRALPATEGGALAEDAARAVLDGIGRFRAAAIGPGLGRDA